MYFYSFAPLIPILTVLLLVPPLGAVLFLASLFVAPTFVAIWVRVGADGTSYDRSQLLRFWTNCMLVACAMLLGVAVFRWY